MVNNGNICSWARGDALMQHYHDTEWGVQVHDDKMLFELLTLEGAQAGLSWRTVLYKRQNYRIAFADFDFYKVKNYKDQDIANLMQNTGIVRNKLKIASTIQNAKMIIDILEEFGSFGKYIWGFTNHQTISNNITCMADLKSSSPEAVAMSKALLKRGFKFVGPKICYAFMQAIGMVDDHEETCHRKLKGKLI